MLLKVGSFIYFIDHDVYRVPQHKSSIFKSLDQPDKVLSGGLGIE